MAWWRKPPNPSGRLRRKLCVQLVKKPPQLDEKTRKENRGEIKNLIDEKPPKLDEEMRRKTDL